MSAVDVSSRRGRGVRRGSLGARRAQERIKRQRVACSWPRLDRIQALFQTDEGAALYAKRQWMIEPVFANTKWIRGIDRFQRRGLQACAAEWKRIAASHNLLKLWRATTAAQAT